ncbi:glycosyltransferase [Corallincola holothuriorum]|uniref:glycosyltransferase n=1 Tax=Corallincola holothuriorum TaxID=2282215 RepID=UPI0013146997|nr:glycosyltransferase [Corallincola holothuriorum]
MLPFVSIVIPAFNEEEYIGRCLLSLEKLDYPKDRFDVRVIDNGSDDDTVKVCRKLGVDVEVKSGVRVGAVRNYGALKSDCDILAFVDSDCEVGTNWLLSAVKEFENESTGAVGGACLAAQDACWVEKAWASSQSVPRKVVKALAGSCFIVRKSIFDDLGGFNESMSAGEDDDLSNRVKLSGYTIVKLKECAVVHLGYPKTLMATMKRQIWHGSYQIESARTKTDKLLWLVHIYSLAVFVLPVLLISLIFGYPSLFFVVAALAAILGIPALATMVKNTRSESNHSGIAITTQRYVLYQVYFVGRMIGLIKNYSRRLFSSQKVVREEE